MTIHYHKERIEDMTPEEVIVGWNWWRGGGIPPAYGIFSLGDWVAYNCWKYLALKKKISPEEFCKDMEEKYKEKMIKLIKEVESILEKKHGRRKIV